MHRGACLHVVIASHRSQAKVDTMQPTLRAHRRASVDHALANSATMRALFAWPARQYALDVLFYGNRRDAVRAAASVWAHGPDASEVSTVQAVCGPETPIYVTVSTQSIEIDLDSAAPAEVRSVFEWVKSKVSSRHVVHDRHVVIIHAVERAPDKSVSLLRSMRTTQLVLSTTTLSAHSVRGLTGCTRIRVPADPVVPRAVQTALTPLKAAPTIRAVREAVNTISGSGFTVAEIGQFAWNVLGKRSLDHADVDARCRICRVVAQLAHASSGISEFDRRALETLILVMCTGPLVLDVTDS